MKATKGFNKRPMVPEIAVSPTCSSERVNKTVDIGFTTISDGDDDVELMMRFRMSADEARLLAKNLLLAADSSELPA